MTRKNVVALVLCASLSAHCSGIRAAQGGAPLRTQPADRSATSVLATAERIPVGSRVKMTLNDGRRFTAVLLGVEGTDVLVRERTRIPEAPLRLPANRIAWLELDTARTGVGKMIAIGAAIGAGVTLGFLAILAASLDD